jgi:regulator of RNase E activity RraA
MMSTICKQIGIAGALVDGAIRDVDEIRDLGFPVWSRGVVPRASPTSVHGRFEPVQVNCPVVVGGLMIAPGDIVVADESGISLVPKSRALEVVARAEAQARKEDEIRDKVKGGVTVADILASYGHV